MKLISQLEIVNNRSNSIIQLLHGDLSAIPPEHATDILVMSAFPGDYTSLRGSLMLALKEKGLSVDELAVNKEIDLRSQLSCWLSKPLSQSQQATFNFTHLLCFEPGEKINEPGTVVGNIFRCINTFVFEDDHNVVAMPLIGTGYQHVPVKKMLPELLRVAVFWLQNGLPLDCIKLVVYNEKDLTVATVIFNEFKSSLIDEKKIALPAQAAPLPTVSLKEKPIAKSKRYDYFLSYAHTHAKEVGLFVQKLKELNKDINIFYDRDSIPAGGMWIKMISSAIENADKVLVFLSPEYDKSPVCWDEFECAKLMEYNKQQRIIQTIYLFNHTETTLPLIMGIYSYIDCREGDKQKLAECVQQLLKNVE